MIPRLLTDFPHCPCSHCGMELTSHTAVLHTALTFPSLLPLSPTDTPAWSIHLFITSRVCTYHPFSKHLLVALMYATRTSFPIRSICPKHLHLFLSFR